MVQKTTLLKRGFSFLLLAGMSLALSAQGVKISSVRNPEKKEAKAGLKKAGLRLSEDQLEGAPRLKEIVSKERLRKASTDDEYSLFSEDFSKFVSGSETNLVAVPKVQDSAYIDPAYTREPLWWGAGVYQAGGACALYSDVNPTLTGGYLTSPQKDCSGELTIKFKIKKYPGLTDTKATFVSIVTGDLYGGTTKITALATAQVPLTDEWEERIYTYTVETTEPACIQINSYTGCLVDDIEVTSKSTVLGKPYAYGATDFVKDGFTASWSKVRLADSYLFTAFRYAPTGKDPVSASEGFDAVNYKDGFVDKDAPNYPEGWDINLTDNGSIGSVYTSGGASSNGEYRNNAPALLLDDEKDYLAIPDNGGKITAFSFWVKMIPPADNPQLSGKVTVEGWDGMNWNSLGLSAEGFSSDYFMKFDLSMFMGMLDYTCFRIVPEKLPAGVSFAIDDVEYETAEPRDLEYAYLDEPVGDTRMVLSGLDPESDYSYYVKSVSEKFPGQTPVSNRVKALGISKPVLKPASDIAKDGYTANWEPTPKAQSYELTNYNIYTAATDEQNHVVLEEDFKKVDVPFTVEEPVEMQTSGRLDEYTQLPGWLGENFSLAEGMLGGLGDAQYQIQGYVATPRLTLGNDDGRFDVTIDAWGHQGDILIAQSAGETQGMQFSSTGLQYVTLKFTKGQNNDQIIFYSYNTLPFFLDKVKITQNVKQGDRTFTETRWKEISGKDNTSYTFKNLDTAYGSQFAYDVVAIYPYTKTISYRSENSDRMFVPDATGVDNVALGKPANGVYAKGDHIYVNLTQPSVILVYNVAGNLVKEIDGQAGENVFTLHAQGVYIVKTVKGATKVVLGK